MERKGLMEGLLENLPDLEEPCTIYLLAKATKPPRGPTTYVSKMSPGFMLQMDFALFNVESIREFTSTFVTICSATPFTFGFPFRSKHPHLDTLKLIVATLSNQDKKVTFVLVGEYGTLAIYSEFMRTCHHKKIIDQTTGGNASSLNGKK